MKQLLLNLLLIFGSAYAFIQCVQLFSLNHKMPEQHRPRATTVSTAINSQNKVAVPLFQGSNTKFNFEDNPVGQFLERSSSLNMMGYFDLQTLFYYPNVNFTSFNLFRKYPDMLAKDKSK